MTNKFLCVLLVIAVLTGCKKKEDEEVTPQDSTSTNTCSSASFSCKINGVPFSASSYNNTLLKGSNGKRLDIRATSGNIQLIVSIADVKPSDDCINLRTGTAYVDAELNTYDGWVNGTAVDGAIGTVKENGEYKFTVPSGGEDVGKVEVTNCDATTNKVSGTFNFQITDFDTGDVAYEITDGVFTDVCFTRL